MRDESPTHDGTIDQPPTLDYAKADTPGKPHLRWWPSAVSIVLISVLVPTFKYADEFSSLDVAGFIATVPAFGLACYGWISNKQKNLLWRAFLMLVAIWAFFPLFKNVVDVLRLRFRI